MTLTVAVQMDPIQRIKIAGDSTFAMLLEAQARGHGLLHYTPERLSHARRPGRRRSPSRSRSATSRAITSPSASRSGSTSRTSTWCCCARTRPSTGLHHDHPSPRTHPSEDPRGQRSGPCPQRAGEDLRHAIPGPDAADPDHARQGRDRGVPGRARRHRHEAALRQWRRGGVQGWPRGPEFRLALRPLRRHLPRALGGAALPAEGHRRRQAHHPRRRRGGGRDQPRSGRRTTSAPTWSAAARRQPTDLTPREREICETIGPAPQARWARSSSAST